ncbi:MAG: DUF58 domain-containing protein, partial [Actinomycetia bacterium]|nr:DUF58 domain-containing protein [Actinomycetes bacterium]
MGQHLNRAKTFFGTDTRGLLEGGRYALLHTKTMEFDDLRPYVPGDDDVRDIDWKATARSATGEPLVKRMVSEKHHKILLVADAGRNMNALAPGGELKRDVAANVIAAIGLISVPRSDEIALVLGDSRASGRLPHRRGETHIESLVERYYQHTVSAPGRSDICEQLRFVASGYRHRMLLIIVSDEPETDDRLAAILKDLTARHDVLWVMVTDQPAVGSAPDEIDGFDVASGKFVLDGETLGPGVIEAYRVAEAARVAKLDTFMTECSVPYTRINSNGEIRDKLVGLTGEFRHV